MKHFDPKSGWEKAPIVSITDQDHRARKSRPGSQADTATPDPDAGDAAVLNKVFHFNRNGKLLRIKGIANTGGTDDPVQAGNPAGATEEAPEPVFPNPLDLLSLSTAIREMFSTLSDGEPSSELNDVVEIMRGLSVKLDERNRLKKTLQELDGEIHLTRNLLNEHILVAQECEKQSLATKKIRVDLMREIVSSLVSCSEERSGP